MDNLNVHVVDQPNNNGGGKNFFTVPKIIFFVLGVIILVELVFAVRTILPFFTSQPASKINNQAVVSTMPKISLTSPAGNFKVQDVIPVAVTVDTAGRDINGVDLIVQFDPKVLDVTSGSLIKGNIFDQYPFLSVDGSKGIISISGIDDLNKSFTGQGLFATMNVKVKVPGKTSLMINFKKGVTTVSNLTEVSTSKNILEQVDNLEINIQ